MRGSESRQDTGRSDGVALAEMVAQITAPHFVAGIVLADDVVVTAAPIVRYMVGWDRGRVRSYVARKGWTIRVVNDQDRPEGRP